MTTTTLEHSAYCLPRPGEDGPRVESYGVATYNRDGTAQVGSMRVVRCVECGNATYDGVQRERN
ncbi:MAG: hypothetical protein M3Q22_04750 [Actinomycetota bacterium]|nr:hypothetical protein [Actinomycetota bacterium]